MAIEKVVRCDSCRVVVEHNLGYAIVGGIHAVDPTDSYLGFDGTGGGILGTALDNRKVVSVTHYCHSCMIKLLGDFNREHSNKPLVRGVVL